MNIEQYNSSLQKLKQPLERLLKETGVFDYGDLSLLEYNKGDSEENFIAQEAATVTRLALGLFDRINYLTLPITTVDELSIVGDELYLGDERLSCGTILEAYVLDENEEFYTWKITHVEHTEKRGYFLYGLSNSSLNNLTCRIRG